MKIQAPGRVRRTYRQRLDAPPERVFPLLCPVREADWVPGWDPSLVLSTSGAAEEDCVFIMPGDDMADAVWVITRHDASAHAVEFVKVTPEHTVGRITITLASDGPQRTVATVTYQYTALSDAGEAFVRGFTEAVYVDVMKEWEQQLNHYLRTGRMLEP
jgi:hypothetical protein